jgi:hypothetical protein
MPTDLLRTLERKRATQRRDFWHDTVLIAGISLTGGIFTIARALQSEAFETALFALATVE